MSYYLIDCTKTIDDLNFDNIIIGRKLKNDSEISKYYIYYQDEPHIDPKEIYIKLPRLRLIYSLANHKYSQLNIPIYPNWDLTNDFIKFIKTFESNIKDCFIKKFPHLDFVSLINKKNLLNFIKTNINDGVKITPANITLNDFKINGQIELVIKLSYIWNKSDARFGLSSQLYQIKYFAPPEQLKIDFIDSELEPPKNIQSNFQSNLQFKASIKEQPVSNTSSTHISTPIQTPPISHPIKFAGPQLLKDLQNALKSLKPRATTND